MIKTVWKGFLKGASSAVATAMFALIAYAEAYAVASSCFFDANLSASPGISFLTMLLFAFQMGAAVYFGVCCYHRAYRRERTGSGFGTFILEIVILLVGAGTVILCMFGGTAEKAVFLQTLPYFLVGIAVAVFFLLIPLAKKKLYFAMVAVCAAVLVVGVVSGVSSIKGEFVFEEAPAVFDNGSDFSVVWCTNRTSVGYLTYTYGGNEYVVRDAEDGKYRADKRVHTVRVPYEHLYGNTYTVSSAEVLSNTPYTSKLGDYITSKEYAFTAEPTSENLRLLSVSDWHENTDSLYRAVEKSGEFDVLLMMGDPANYLDEFDDILNFIIVPGGRIAGGTKPILYARGNHEPRGKCAGDLKEVLGLDSFYYVATYGERNFLVFDGGEDKADGNAEYGGLIVSEPYRAEELQYMDSLPVLEGTNICLCHVPLFTFAKDVEGRQKFASILEKQNVKLEISGHRHRLEYIDGEKYDILVDGGLFDSGEYVVCMVDIDGDVATITAIDEYGKMRAEYGPVVLK